jgi:hypothetical protein
VNQPLVAPLSRQRRRKVWVHADTDRAGSLHYRIEYLPSYQAGQGLG